MKRIKKLASLLLAMIMVLAMTITAFAGEPTDPSEGSEPSAPVKKYQIYQIFTGDYADGVLSNIKWGENGTGTKGAKVDEAILDELEAVADEEKNLDTAQLAVIQKYANLDSTPIRTGDETEYTGLTPGYYLVRNTAHALDNEENAYYTLYVVKVVNTTLSFIPKGDIPTPDKKIVEGEDRVTTNEASIGDVVNYEITGTMPSNIADYKTYYYMFTDTLSEGLTFNKGSITVKVNNVDVTNYFYKAINGNKIGTDGSWDGDDSTEISETTIEVGILDIKALSLLTNPAVGPITADTEVVLTYSATLNESAVIAGDGNPNDVKLSYSNDPNNSGNGSTTPPPNPDEPEPTHPVGESPRKEVVTYTTELTIKKTNEEDQNLPFVEFTLTGNGVNVVLVTEEIFTEAADGTYWKLKDDTYTTTAPTKTEYDSDGKVTVAGNEDDYVAPDADGNYTKYTKTTSVIAKGTGKGEEGEDGVKGNTEVIGIVKEDGTVTFTGLGAGDYTITETRTLPGYNTIEPISFTLTFEDGKFVSSNDEISVGTTNLLNASIVNHKGSLLPSTGGIGTTIFYVVGSILVIGAGILLVAKKRMSANK